MFDYAIQNGLVVDGTGQPAYQSTVYLKDGLIALISEDSFLPSAEVIDAAGKVVAPGFIDLHTHSDVAPFCGPNFESAVYQGVTCHIAGNCGYSVVPNNGNTHNSVFRSRSSLYYVEEMTGEETDAYDVTSYGMAVEQRMLPIHLGLLVGHGTLRSMVMGNENREPTPEELKQMQQVLEQNLAQGAFGMSLGLTYIPGAYSRTIELIELAKVVAAYDGVVAVHMRSESANVFEAVEEMLTVAREAKVKLHISHLKLMFKKQWGQAHQLLQVLDKGRADGLTISADQYPYCASSTGAQALLPGFAKRGSKGEFEARFDDPGVYEQIKRAVIESMEKRGGPSATTIANTRGRLPEADGKHLGELAEMWGISPADAYCRVMRRCVGAASAVYHAMDLQDVLKIMSSMEVAVGSDGYAHDYLTKPILGKPHPRSVGTFPRYLQLVRDNDLMSMEQAVYKITGLAAKIMSLPELGALLPGMSGDITVFDWETVKDCTTFQSPSIKPEGIYHVFVGGRPVLLNCIQTKERNGRFLTRKVK